MSDLVGAGDLGDVLRQAGNRFDSAAERAQFLHALSRMAVSPERCDRFAAATRLGRFLDDPDGHGEWLIRALIADPDNLVAHSASRVILRHGSVDLKAELRPRIIAVLLAAARSARGQELVGILSALAQFPDHADTILPILIVALGAGDPYERHFASNAIAELALAAPAVATHAAAALQQALQSETESWVTPDWSLDLRMVHAGHLFWVLGDNPASRAVIIDKHDAAIPHWLQLWTAQIARRRVHLATN